MTETDSTTARPWFWPLLLLLCAFAAVQSLWMRHALGLSIDEPFTANAIALGWPRLFEVFPHDNVPLYYVLLKAWTRLAGDSAFALRSFSAAAFTLAVLVTGLSGRAAGGSGAGLLAALFVATSTGVGLLHAATGRAYALVGLIAALAVWTGLRTIAGGASRVRLSLDAVALCAIVVTGLFTHPMFLPFSAAIVLAAFAGGVRSGARALLAVAGAVAIYAAAWWPVLDQTLHLPATSWMVRPGLIDLQNVPLFLWTSRNGFMLVGCTLTLLFVAGRTMFDLVRRPAFVFVALVAAFGLLIPFTASFVRPIYHSVRTTALVLPALSLVFGLVLARFSKPALTAVIAFLFVASSVQYSTTVARSGDPNPTEASLAAVLGQARCGDVIVAAGLSYSEITYFGNRLHAPSCLRVVPIPAEVAAHPGWLDEPSVLGRADGLNREATALVATLVPGQRAFVFGRSKGIGARVCRNVRAVLDAGCPLLQTLELGGSFFDTVWVYGARAQPRGDR
jgi:mannosyltransferase